MSASERGSDRLDARDGRQQRKDDQAERRTLYDERVHEPRPLDSEGDNLGRKEAESRSIGERQLVV